MGIDQQSTELGLAFTCIQIAKGGVALAVGGNGSGAIEAFGASLVASLWGTFTGAASGFTRVPAVSATQLPLPSGLNTAP